MQSQSPDKKGNPQKALTLRLPDSLRESADKYAQATGLSLNGLICVALADYLRARDRQPKG